MKKILEKLDQLKLGHKLHQLQKRYKRAKLNGYSNKMESKEFTELDLNDKMLEIEEGPNMP
jgi:hypothetical protein